MPKLPLISTAAAIKAFARVGYVRDDQHGSHVILVLTGPRVAATGRRAGRLSVPERRELARGTLRHLIRDAGMTIEEFLALLDQI